MLHSPNRHPALHAKLAADFEVLDQTTGPALLFFTAVEPSEEWIQSASGRHYFSRIRTSYTAGPRGLACADPDAALCALARAFSIPVGELPALVVISPRTPDHWVVLRTSAMEIEQQLTRLGRCAEERPQGSNLRERLQKWRLDDVLQLPVSPDALDSRGGRFGMRNRALGRAVLALAGTAIHCGFPCSEGAKEVLEDEVSSLAMRNGLKLSRGEARDWAQMDFVMGMSEEPDEQQMGPLLDAAFYLGALHGRAQATPDPGLCLLLGLDRSRLELETSNALTSADAITGSGVTLEDYSPLMICVAKAFESEVNASLVQFYRQMLGIQMPEFFKRHAPGVTALGDEGLRPVDLNAKRLHGWHAPSLGESLWVAVKKGEKPVELGAEQFERLTSIWTEMLPMRNRAAHTGLVRLPDFEHAAGLWVELKEAGLLAGLLKLKARLAG